MPTTRDVRRRHTGEAQARDDGEDDGDDEMEERSRLGNVRKRRHGRRRRRGRGGGQGREGHATTTVATTRAGAAGFTAARVARAATPAQQSTTRARACAPTPASVVPYVPDVLEDVGDVGAVENMDLHICASNSWTKEIKKKFKMAEKQVAKKLCGKAQNSPSRSTHSSSRRIATGCRGDGRDPVDDDDDDDEEDEDDDDDDDDDKSADEDADDDDDEDAYRIAPIYEESGDEDGDAARRRRRRAARRRRRRASRGARRRVAPDRIVAMYILKKSTIVDINIDSQLSNENHVEMIKELKELREKNGGNPVTAGPDVDRAADERWKCALETSNEEIYILYNLLYQIKQPMKNIIYIIDIVYVLFKYAMHYFECDKYDEDVKSLDRGQFPQGFFQ